MNLSDIFNIAFSVKLAGLENESQLSRTFFMRSGRRLEYSQIKILYEEILKTISKFGYSDPLDFLSDYFPNENFEKIKIFKKNLNLKLNITKNDYSPPKEVPEAVVSTSTQQVSEEENKATKVVPTKVENTGKEENIKQIQIINKSILDNLGSSFKDVMNIEMTSKEKGKILKMKKLNKKYREMDVKEKEMDNRFDFFIYRNKSEQLLNKSDTNESDPILNNTEDNRDLLEVFPAIIAGFNDLDLEFKDIMYKIYKYNRNQTKDKSKYNQEMDFLEEYFLRKLDIPKNTEEMNRKLSNAIAYLMKKIQNNIFESSDKNAIEILLFFKSKLYSFYNYYRK